MSLINQMLHDLESRRASGAVLPDQVRALPPVRKFEPPWWLFDFACAAALVGLVGLQSRDQSAAAPPSPVANFPAVNIAAPAVAVLRRTLELENSPVIEPPSVRPRPPSPIKQPVPTAAVLSEVTAPDVEARAEKSAAKVTAPVAAPMVLANAKPAALLLKTPDSAVEIIAPAQIIHPQIDKRAQQMTPSQLSEVEYRDAANLLNQGQLAEAQEGFRRALQIYPAHAGARQGLFGLLLDAKKNGEAERVIEDGLALNPNHPGFAMALARLRVDRGDNAGAINVLQKTASVASGNPDYIAFLAALMQRQSRHQEAVDNFRAALRLAPGSGVWLMGLGISLQALNRNSEAQDAFRRARETNTLNADLQAFVDLRLKQLR
jgi:MSHA biogenesis protein MshN